MSYATPQDIINRYPNRDLVQLTNEDPTITTIASTVLQQALRKATHQPWKSTVIWAVASHCP